jgi:hypothetical protein
MLQSVCRVQRVAAGVAGDNKATAAIHNGRLDT